MAGRRRTDTHHHARWRPRQEVPPSAGARAASCLLCAVGERESGADLITPGAGQRSAAPPPPPWLGATRTDAPHHAWWRPRHEVHSRGREGHLPGGPSAVRCRASTEAFRAQSRAPGSSGLVQRDVCARRGTDNGCPGPASPSRAARRPVRRWRPPPGGWRAPHPRAGRGAGTVRTVVLCGLSSSKKHRFHRTQVHEGASSYSPLMVSGGMPHGPPRFTCWRRVLRY
jgi:hypothetical protein